MPIDFKTIESSFIEETPLCAESKNGLVTTQSSQASEAGAEILRCGGNAVDAAVAAALAVGVAEPQASGLGGQTMMLISHEDQVIAVDGSSRAPSLAHVSAVYKRDRSTGYRATTVPSTPATLWSASLPRNPSLRSCGFTAPTTWPCLTAQLPIREPGAQAADCPATPDRKRTLRYQ